MNSIDVFTSNPKATTISSVRSRPPAMPIAEVFSFKPRRESTIVLAKSPHSANTSPCAKLISCKMPYTSV